MVRKYNVGLYIGLPLFPENYQVKSRFDLLWLNMAKA